MSELTVGEHIKGYKPVDKEVGHALKEKEGSSKIQKTGFKLATASFLASLGLLGASTTGQGPIESIRDVASTTSDVATHTTGELQDRVEGFKNTWKHGTPDPNDPRNK